MTTGSSDDGGSGGYHGPALHMLYDAGARVGDTIIITSDDGRTTHRGLLMPRYEHDDDTHIVVKLGSGYNVGVDTGSIAKISVIKDQAPAASATDGSSAASQDSGSTSTVETPAASATDGSSEKTMHDMNRKRILLLSTGGTIASRVDYRTGGVTPVLSADDLADAIPELAEIADVDAEVVVSEYSENITPEHWLELARHIDGRAGMMGAAAGSSIVDNDDDDQATGQQHGPYSGIIIAHGTDTMHYTSAFLSFALAGFPAPIVLVGAQRSPDRASSDAATNLVAAARFISSYDGSGGVYIAMHSDTGDDAIAVHLGTRVRKNHTSRRDAFQTIGGKPAFVISAADGSMTGVSDDYDKTAYAGRFFAAASYAPRISLDTRVALVKYHPGYDSKILDYIISSGCRAIIFEGTGLGHVGRTLYDQVSRAARGGIFMGMTSQCIDGRVSMTVYESGRDLAGMGVVPLGNIIPEVALVKAMWAAAGADDAKGIEKIMLRCMASEMSA